MAFVVRRAGSGGGPPPRPALHGGCRLTCAAKQRRAGTLCRRQSCNGLPAALERGGAPGAIGRRSRASKASVALATQPAEGRRFLCALAQRTILRINYFIISALISLFPHFISLFRTYFGFAHIF